MFGMFVNVCLFESLNIKYYKQTFCTSCTKFVYRADALRNILQMGVDLHAAQAVNAGCIYSNKGRASMLRKQPCLYPSFFLGGGDQLYIRGILNRGI